MAHNLHVEEDMEKITAHRWNDYRKTTIVLEREADAKHIAGKLMVQPVGIHRGLTAMSGPTRLCDGWQITVFGTESGCRQALKQACKEYQVEFVNG